MLGGLRTTERPDGAAQIERGVERMIERELKKGRAVKTPAHLTARVVDAAVREGIVDVAYTAIDSPLGTWLAAMTQRGLVRISLRDDFDDVLADLARRVSPRVLEVPKRFDGLRR